MILCFDFGNTLKKYAFVEQQKIVLLGHLSSFNSDELPLLVRQKKIDKIVISSVIDIPSSFLQNLEKIAPVVYINEELISTILQYQSYDPSSLGIDRKILAIGALRNYPNKNLLVISLGSCITYNIVCLESKFGGGVISPGLEMRAKAMHEFTDKLPLVDWKNQALQNLFGINTNENLAHGIVTAVKFEIEGFIKQFKDIFPSGMVLLTGGDALFIKKLFPEKTFIVDENLLWKGMQEIVS